MPHLPKASLRDRIRIKFAEADFEIGFSLVDIAEAESIFGNYAQAARILRDADDVIVDIQQILCRLQIPDRGPFEPLLGELNRAIGLAKMRIASSQ
jgi:hypothetical protein